MYHMKQGWSDVQDMQIHERKWLIDRFVEQKKREDEQIKRGQKSTRMPSAPRAPGRR